MSELPGSSAVSIESVEWAAESGGNLNVRIPGRWRRRRPVSSGQPTLVIEAEGRRHRYPAMPEPPSVGGTGPGLWRLSFTIPGWMAPDLGRTWLQFGTVVVPLPVAVPAPGEVLANWAESQSSPPKDRPPAPQSPPAEPAGPEPPVLASVPPPGEPAGPEPPEPASGDPSLEARITELASRVDSLEQELAEGRDDRDRLPGGVAARAGSRG